MRKNIFRVLLILTVLVTAVAMLVACGGGGDSPSTPPTGISLSKSNLTIERGGSASLSAIITPDDATKTVTWASSDTTIATVSGGVVKGVLEGEAIISATTINGKMATCTVTVTMPRSEVIPVKSVAVVPSTRTFDNIGDTYTLRAEVYPDYATYRETTWLSTNPDVATVTSDGIITATGYGEAEIRAKAHNGVYGVCTVIVKTPLSVKFMFEGEQVGETTTFAETGGKITFPTNTEPTAGNPTYLAVPDISTVPTSERYVESWYLDEDFTIPYEDGMDVSEYLVLYGKPAYAYEYDIISGTDGNYIRITKFLPDTARQVTIPSIMGGHPVTAIGEGAFEGATLTGVTVPACVVTISDDAFRDCKMLESVEFSGMSLLTHIGDSAFRGCSSLDTIQIPESVQFIGTLALYGTDTDKATQLSSKGFIEKQYYTPKYVYEFLGEDVMPIGAYGEIVSNDRYSGNTPAGVCDPNYGVGLEKALREFVESGCNLMEANSHVNAVQSYDPNEDRSYAQYMKILEEYGGMMLYKGSGYTMLEEEYEGNAEGFEKFPDHYTPTANATLNAHYNNFYYKYASFAGVLVADEPGWVEWIDEFEEPYTYYQRTGSSGSSDLAVDGDGNYITLEGKTKGRMDDGHRVWRQYMPDKLFFVNLLQTYAPKWALPNGYYGYNDGGQLDGIPNFTGDSAPLPGEIDYEYYYRTYIENVKPQVFSYDYYPLADSGTNLYNTHFEQLNYANYYAGDYYKQYYGTETGIPWWPCIQVNGWNGYRQGIGAKLSEISWQINTAFAYGAKGYTYFTYAGVSKDMVGSAVNYYGVKTGTYKNIQAVNEYSQAMAKWLLNAEVDHITQFGQNPNCYDVNTKTTTSPEQTPQRMLTPRDTSMNWTLESTLGVPNIVSHMKYYANNNYYQEGVDGDVREMYFICNNTIDKDGAIIINFSKTITCSYIHRGVEYRFTGNQLKVNTLAGEGVAILLDK